jgi:hypothetical protein
VLIEYSPLAGTPRASQRRLVAGAAAVGCTAPMLVPQVVVDVYTDGALVWVHNYHLLLLPQYLMRKARTPRTPRLARLHAHRPARNMVRSDAGEK